MLGVRNLALLWSRHGESALHAPERADRQACLKIDGDWSWRLPFVVQWVWVIPLFLIVFFAPSSPWWLVRKGRLAEAEASVRRLTNPDYFGEQDVKNAVAMMQHTNELEIAASEGTSYIYCFRGIDRRRTEIVMMIFASQLLSGQNLIGQGGSRQRLALTSQVYSSSKQRVCRPT